MRVLALTTAAARPRRVGPELVERDLAGDGVDRDEETGRGPLGRLLAGRHDRSRRVPPEASRRS